ncbi:hypothetical protein HDU86_006987 [Geranomyces michiganensis]|nr:hypothetical protein HDU86_006987 [Geranomyces michiganensis]
MVTIQQDTILKKPFLPSFELADRIVGHLWPDIMVLLNTRLYLELLLISRLFQSVLERPSRRRALQQAQAACLRDGGRDRFANPLANPYVSPLDFLAKLIMNSNGDKEVAQRVFKLWRKNTACIDQRIQDRTQTGLFICKGEEKSTGSEITAAAPHYTPIYYANHSREPAVVFLHHITITGTFDVFRNGYALIEGCGNPDTTSGYVWLQSSHGWIKKLDKLYEVGMW